MPGWQTIVFDLDDTLYPERDYVLSGFRAVATWAEAHLGIPAPKGFAELEALFAQGVRGHVFDRWLSAHGKPDPALIPQLVEVYRGHRPSLKPFDTVPELLAGLRRRHRLGIVSDGHLSVQQRKLDALQLGQYFDAVVFSDTWGRDAWKPSPRPFAEALSRLSGTAESSVYVGDNPTKDFLGARQLGMFTIQLRLCEGEYCHLDPPTPQHAPDRVVTSIPGLHELLTAGSMN